MPQEKLTLDSMLKAGTLGHHMSAHRAFLDADDRAAERRKKAGVPKKGASTTEFPRIPAGPRGRINKVLTSLLRDAR